MNKKILIFLVSVTVIFSLCAVIVSASDTECKHNNISSNRVYSNNSSGFCYIAEHSCMDCGYTSKRVEQHIDIDGECLECGLNLIDDVCEHRWDLGYCRECGYWCLHFYEDGNCITCGEPCIHSLGYVNGYCVECGSMHDHIYEDGYCTICGEECVHNWVEYDRKYTHFRNSDCYTSYARCEYCNEEWANGFGHVVNLYNVCVNCDIYMICLHDWLYEGECTDCGWKCEHIYDGWGKCHICGLNCQHTNRLTDTDENPFPKPNGFCWYTFEKCLDCNFEFQHIYYSHEFDNGKCVDCGTSLDGVTCKHNTFSLSDEGFTLNQNEYCYRVIKDCVDCKYVTYENVSHNYVKGVCLHCNIKFVSGHEEQIRQEGYNDGKKDGESKGYNDGYKAGKTEGYDSGVGVGFENGKTLGYEEGYTNGVGEGYAEGKTDGYREGIQAASDGEMGNLFYELFNAEVNVFQNMLNFEIFGINIATFMMSILSILVIAWIIKKVI